MLPPNDSSGYGVSFVTNLENFSPYYHVDSV